MIGRVNRNLLTTSPHDTGSMTASLDNDQVRPSMNFWLWLPGRKELLAISLALMSITMVPPELFDATHRDYGAELVGPYSLA